MYTALDTIKAIASMNGTNDLPPIRGEVTFIQKRNCVLVIADIAALPENKSGFYGFHIHEGTSCDGEGFSQSRGHYNPQGKPHPQHAGDLPPLMLCGKGSYMQVLTDRFRVADIIGRTVIIHDMADDFHTQPSGNAGTKIACGVIKRG